MISWQASREIEHRVIGFEHPADLGLLNPGPARLHYRFGKKQRNSHRTDAGSPPAAGDADHRDPRHPRAAAVNTPQQARPAGRPQLSAEPNERFIDVGYLRYDRDVLAPPLGNSDPGRLGDWQGKIRDQSGLRVADRNRTPIVLPGVVVEPQHPGTFR